MNRLSQHLIFAIVGLVFSIAVNAAATMWCVNGTNQCAFGTPSTSKLSLVDRGKSLYSMTVAKYNEAAGNKTFEEKTSTELIALAKALIASQVCNPATHTGTWPNCTPIPPPVCPQYTVGIHPDCAPIPCATGFVGNEPDCKPAPPPPAGPPPTPPPAAGSTIIQVGLMPAVDISKQIAPAVGYSTLRIKPTTEVGPSTGGAFRIVCTPSHMSNDDPIVYHNQQGAAHNHTFFGNTSVDFKSDLMAFSTTGNSTCNGGIMNRSAYWVPSMIDTSTKTPKTPEVAIFYYKNGRVPAGLIQVPPKGLRMIAGTAKATSAETSSATYTCLAPSGSNREFYGWHNTIQNCPVGDTLQMHVAFPQCWDGINLDSPGHQSHMAYTKRTLTTANKCPTTHPVALPEVTVNFNYKIKTVDMTKNWRLASDNYDNKLPGGYSSHADWVNGWDEIFLKTFIANCLNKNIDCHAHLLGDGRMFN